MLQPIGQNISSKYNRPVFRSSSNFPDTDRINNNLDLLVQEKQKQNMKSRERNIPKGLGSCKL